jgi:hypothetical protein
VNRMSRRNYIIGALVGLVVTFGLLYFYGGNTTPATQPTLVRLTPENISQLEAAFNAAKGDVRVLVLLSPT